jgi:AcrR family transcriptional regulator
MAPEDRRAALIEATIPLLHEHGLDVSTRRIAEAAGVAEGTIFGVFPDKHSLVLAAMLQALDPQPTLDELAGIDPGLELRLRLVRAADLINGRFTGNAAIMSAARSLAHFSGAQSTAGAQMADTRRRLLEALTALVQPDEAKLRRSAGTVARLLLLFCGANTYGPFGDPDRFNGAEMVSLLLDGLLVIDTGAETLTVPLFGAKTDITGVP